MTEFKPFDAAKYLDSEEAIAIFIEEVMQDGRNDDAALITHILGTIARARNMSQLARDTCMSREGIYKALSGEGNPSLATVARIANALDLRITIEPARPAA